MSVALQHRVKKLLASQAEMASAKSLLGSLPPLVAIDVGGTTAGVRTALKSSLDNASLRVAEGLLSEMDVVLASISALQQKAEAMDVTCQHVAAYLDTTERTSNAFVAQAAALTGEQRALQAEMDETKQFLSQHQVDPVDVALLEAPALDGNDDAMTVFFDVLSRVGGIKSNCKRLVEANPGPTSLELLDRVGQHQDAAYDKLYQWTLQHCGGAETEPSRLLHHAMRHLVARPAFYAHCKEALVAARRGAILRRFIIALTRGGPNGIPRPIEIHSHDPVRYAGDMLAWVHAAIASEHEYFKVLLDGAEAGETQRLVGQAFEGIARPLEVRLQQTLTGQTACPVVYQVVHLLGFYCVTMAKLVPQDAELSTVLVESLARARTSFEKQWQHQVDVFQAVMQEDRADFTLVAAHATLDTTHKLAHLLDIYQSALLPFGAQAADVAPVIECFVVALAASSKQRHADPSDALVFQLNQLGCVHATLSRYEALAGAWVAELSRDIGASIDALATAQASVVLQRCGVATLLERMAAVHEVYLVDAGSAMPGLDVDSVRIVVHNFCSLLMALELPAIERISQPDVRDEAYTRAARRLCDAYGAIHAFVFAPVMGYAQPSTIVVHTPKEIETILDLAS
ncbi:hypothetical protein SDRG_04604 [Saprolegnia diclina VS20]|uniref:Conserved oligomeric Golgi complex subunit 6 n=1 Tax=Saprolegnia diclina (strain VS20) TaxID=1156394 RepID=T0QVW0_SAPDV|nr:hypothetical protein SDRG_04604 [Saprolegnia diclina VS20]EQC38175.1 hypothetical protein SDRG_04604 [Saprolegnia diclina VS20]|eukprot:XP_008608502.1 hypothetical protein SDRG_04604 [Saprolegnia diclina VS20]